jgi:hypothetical protein
MLTIFYADCSKSVKIDRFSLVTDKGLKLPIATEAKLFKFAEGKNLVIEAIDIVDIQDQYNNVYPTLVMVLGGQFDDLPEEEPAIAESEDPECDGLF